MKIPKQSLSQCLLRSLQKKPLRMYLKILMMNLSNLMETILKNVSSCN